MRDTHEEQRKAATGWACATLIRYKIEFYSTPWGWDIACPWGWETPSSWAELVDVAKRIIRNKQ